MRRTRIILWLRVLLPLAALAILSMLFLLARRSDPDAAIPYARAALEQAGGSAGIGEPRFSAVTADGSTVTLSAARADPGPDGGLARDVVLDWRRPDGLTATANAGGAAREGALISLSGDVTVTLSSGWRLTAPRIEADTDAGVMTAPGPVSVTAPFGTLGAGGMRLSGAAAAGGAAGPAAAPGSDPAVAPVRSPPGAGRPVLELNHGVRLLYRPAPDGASAAPGPAAPITPAERR